MAPEKRSPREAGIGRKLAGWARCNSNLLEAVLLAAVFAGLAWQGGR